MPARYDSPPTEFEPWSGTITEMSKGCNIFVNPLGMTPNFALTFGDVKAFFTLSSI